MRKKTMLTSVAVAILLTACGTDSSKIDQFNISQDLDKGNYESVIAKLGDCSNQAGDAKIECLTNLGAAYFGLANFDTISLGQELLAIENDKSLVTDEQRDEKFNEVIMGKLVNENLKKGTDAFTKILEENDKVCNDVDYKNLDKSKKNACLSINPILLKNSLEDDKSSNTSNTSATLNDVIAFKDVLQNAAPGLDGSKLVTIINNNTPKSEDDANSNGELDIVEATRCAIEAYNTNNKNVCTNVSIVEDKANTFDAANVDVKYSNIVSVNVTIGGKIYHRQVKQTAGTYSAISLDTNKIVNNALETVTSDISDPNAFYMPMLSDSGSVDTLDNSITNVLNDEEKFKRIALLTNAEDDNQTEQQKIDKLRKEICDINNNGINTDAGECNLDNGKVVFTQAVVLNYMKKN